MLTVVAVLLAASAVLLVLPPRSGPAHDRLSRVAGRQPGRAAKDGGSLGLSAHHLAAGGAGLVTFLFLGGAAGAGAGLLAAVLLSRWLAGLEPRAVRRRRAQLEADLPVAADLLAACLSAGCPPADAAHAVANALGGPLAAEFRTVVATLRLGGDQAASWLQLAREPVLTPLARCWARALETGAPLADAMTRLADEQRSARRWAAEAEARRCGVRAAAPLGVCFLPAFVLIGVVPAVAGVASGLLR